MSLRHQQRQDGGGVGGGQASPSGTPPSPSGSGEGGGEGDDLSIVRRIEEEILSARRASDLARSRIRGASLAASGGGGGGAGGGGGGGSSPRKAKDGKAREEEEAAPAPAASPSADTPRSAALLINPLAALELGLPASRSASGGAAKASPGSGRGAAGAGAACEPSFDLMEDILNIQETESELLHLRDTGSGGSSSGSGGSGRREGEGVSADYKKAAPKPPPSPPARTRRPKSPGEENHHQPDDEDDEGFLHAMDVIGEEFGESAAGPARSGDGGGRPGSAASAAAASLASLALPSRSGSSGMLGEDDGEDDRRRPSSGSVSTTSSDRAVQEALSHGETAGQRARAILDTLKSRRERFSSTFRTNSAGISAAVEVGRSGSSRSLGSGGAEAAGSPPPSSSARSTPEPSEEPAPPVPSLRGSPKAAPGAPPAEASAGPAADGPFFFGRRHRFPAAASPPSSSSSSPPAAAAPMPPPPPRRTGGGDPSGATDADEKKDDDASASLPSALPAFDAGRKSAAAAAASSSGAVPAGPPAAAREEIGGHAAPAAATTTTTTLAGTPTAMRRGSLPAPDKKKFKSRSYHQKLLQQQQEAAAHGAGAAGAANAKRSPTGAAPAPSAPGTATSEATLDESGAGPSPRLARARRKTPPSESSPAAAANFASAPNSAASGSSSSGGSRRIRFRDPFPVLKPSSRPRDAASLAAAHAAPPPAPVARWLRPKNDLRQLLVAVMGSSIQRRAHACGALKVLTQNKRNQLTLMRTDSFLEALVFAASQDIPSRELGADRGDDEEEDDDDEDDSRGGRDRARRRRGRSRGGQRPSRGKDDVLLAIDARTRAVACLRNVCEPKDNRGHVVLYPGFKEALMRVISEPDEGPVELSQKQHKNVHKSDGAEEARVIACGAFALLAKSPECRETLVSTAGLVDLLARVMAGPTGDDGDGEGEGGEEAVTAALSAETSRSGAGSLSRSASLQAKRSSMSSPGAQSAKEEDCDEGDDEEHSDVSDSENDYHSHSSGHSSEYTSHPSETENDDDDEDDDNYDNAEENQDKGRHRSRRASSKGRDRARRDDLPPRAFTKTDSASSNPSRADELAQVDSIRRINREMRAELVQRARSNACAALLHLSKHCAVSNVLCGNACLLENLVAVSSERGNPIHTKCLEILCHLTRFPANAPAMTAFEGLVDALVSAIESSEDPADRVPALRSLQNMSADPYSKTLLANESVLSAICAAALRRGGSDEEREAAVAFLYNVSTEPGAVVSITNTKNVVATLVHLAHSPDSASSVRLMACDALATISLWLQTLAGTGRVPPEVENVPLPSQKTTGWDRWD